MKEAWRKRGRRATGGAAQNRVAAGSGSASRLSLAIALVRRVKVGINGRRTLLEYGRGDEDGGRGKGPSRSAVGARHGGAIAAVGVSSWVPKEEKLSWRTDALRASLFPFLSLSLSFSFSFLFSSSLLLARLLHFLPKKERRILSTRERRGRRATRVRSSGRFLVSFAFIVSSGKTLGARQIFME